MLLSFLGHMIALAAAAVAVLGDTWNSKAVGWRKLTLTGRAVVAVALAGFLLSSAATYREYEAQQKRRAAAVEEISIAWRGLVSPYRMMLWKLDGRQSNPDASLIRRALEPATFEQMNRIDLRGNAPHHHGLWKNIICGSATRGHAELRRTQTIYVGIVDPDLITAMKNVATDYMIEAMKGLTPCGQYAPDEAFPLRLYSITNQRELRRYLNRLLELRLELDKG